MLDKRFYLLEIVKNIRIVDPYKIILFGSYADETFSDDSDIDLVVVLDSSKISKDYEEKMQNKLLVRRNIYGLTKQIPIDLVVYTKGEYDILSQNNASFFQEIKKKGKVLYEKAD
ncbi:nucleotidyltransferase domain-containing protein [Candidatus Electronema sp. TJ]|uniref:nucleotidyltransferase domain-containing protein n=1 Tax=Candidatus Electronema sp. TJ TaxID=3401573 RepID=UPI003AA7BF9B